MLADAAAAVVRRHACAQEYKTLPLSFLWSAVFDDTL